MENVENKQVEGVGLDTPAKAAGYSTNAQPAVKRVLATINFIQGTMCNNGQSRYQHRELFLVKRPVRFERHCADCLSVIEKGNLCAAGVVSVYCLNCVAEMDLGEALLHSQTRDCAPEDAARLRGEKYGLVSVREFNHEVSVAEGRA